MLPCASFCPKNKAPGTNKLLSSPPPLLFLLPAFLRLDPPDLLRVHLVIYILDKDAYQELLDKTNNQFKYENPLTDEILFPLTVNHFPLSISDIKNNNTFIKSRQRTVFEKLIAKY